MFKPKKKDLNQPVTVADLIEFKDGIGDVVTDIVQKEVGSAKDAILASNDKLMHEVKAMREEQKAHSGNHKNITEDIQGLKKRMNRAEAHVGIS